MTKNLVLIMLLLSTACASAQQRPHPLMGIPHFQCVAALPRQVICMDTLSKEDCDILQDAAEHMNFVLGYDFFTRGREPMHEQRFSNYTVVVGYESVLEKEDPFQQRQTVMETRFIADRDTGCISQVAIAIKLPLRGFSFASKDTFFRHELGHVLGLPHEEEGAGGLMQTGFKTTLVEPVEFSIPELRVIKAVYPFTHPEGL